MVVRPASERGQLLPGSPAAFQILLDPEAGSERLLQRVLELPPEASSGVGHGGADDVLYVAGGSGVLVSGLEEEEHPLRPGSAALIPFKVPAYVVNTDADALVIISVLSPPPFDAFFTADIRDLPVSIVHEDERDPLPVGEDRYFKLLVQSDHVSQFVGFIDRSKAPPHTHSYEEALYVLNGEGLVHAEGSTTPVRPGTSIFLPPGTSHCLENLSPGMLKLLGVFSPPGSPADKQEPPAGA